MVKPEGQRHCDPYEAQNMEKQSLFRKLVSPDNSDKFNNSLVVFKKIVAHARKCSVKNKNISVL